MKRFIFAKAVAGLALAGLCAADMAPAQEACDLEKWPQDKTNAKIKFAPGQTEIGADDNRVLSQFLENTKALREQCDMAVKITVTAETPKAGQARCVSVGKALLRQSDAMQLTCMNLVRRQNGKSRIERDTARIMIGATSKKLKKPKGKTI